MARQTADCRALAVARGWTVAHIFTDNDVSAYSGKPRKGYRALLAAIESGAVDVVLAWHPDRLHRSPVELEGFIALVEAHGVSIETVQAGQFDLGTPSGRMVARQLGSVARYESEHRSERLRRKLEANATEGRAHGRRAYGWQRSYDPQTGRGSEVLDPTEAAVVREIAQRIISGDSLRSITRDLNERGINSPTGKPWAKGMLRHVVLRERNAGLRIHHGKVIGKAAWEPILDVGTWEQMRALLSDPTRRTATGTAAAHLLSGIARCAVCGGVMRAAQNRSVASYRCADRSCVSRNRADVDALVTAVILGRLGRPDAVNLLSPRRSDEQRQAATDNQTLRARLDNAADEYADGKIDARQMERITARLRPQIEAAAARARVVDDSPLLDGLVGNQKAETVWAAMSLSQRRAVVDLLITVEVLRAKQGARTFDPGTVSIEWRQL